MSRTDIISLLERYSKGETSADENLRIEKWLADHQNPDNQWQQLDPVGRQRWLDEVFADVELTIGKRAPVIFMHPRRRLWQVVGAAAILLICIGLLWRLTDSPAHLTVLQTAANQNKEVVLSDGSRIRLNAGSELQYPEKFSEDTREVYLTGEAFFDIQHDDHKTFIVHTGSLNTTVLGTAFNIKARKADKQITVTVTRGKVSVSEGERLLGFITPNQQISYNVQSKMPVKSVVDAAEAIAWQAGDLRFEDITFREAAKVLTERFHVKITFSNDQIKECRFSGTALSGKSIDQILKVVCTFNNASYRYHEDGSVTIYGKGCN